MTTWTHLTTSTPFQTPSLRFVIQGCGCMSSTEIPKESGVSCRSSDESAIRGTGNYATGSKHHIPRNQKQRTGVRSATVDPRKVLLVLVLLTWIWNKILCVLSAINIRIESFQVYLISIMFCNLNSRNRNSLARRLPLNHFERTYRFF